MSKKTTTVPAAFEPEFVEALRVMFEEHITFNRVLGLKIADVQPEVVTGSIAMKPELVGHFHYNRVHGGVTSACLDAMGGLAAMAAIGARHLDEPVAERMQRFSKLGTIDLRVDYLRPVIGDRFDLRAEVLRLGSRVATTRMEWKGADGKLLAVAMGAYIVS
ncbi:thioesterase family protein [Caenimonas sedimenti]|uniref:Medium/long-chain acyl-CoA thioesterase YigI n=1 Tax=Caenimonas sedimenti TaxID=2596921 RepID=A0A562ZPN5_9BURK|nr:thioesterase family protein [Caenimonas sedimenti]TWO70265.1 thioesterase family protein [Caenimonas sedimenti]